MAETDTAAAPETREITLHYDGCDWKHHVKQPTEGQTVQIIGLMDAKGINDQDATPEQRSRHMRRAIDMIRTARTLAQGLHANPDEWRRLTTAMALGEANDSVIYDVILGALDAWEPEPANREERRARAKKATRKA